MKTHRTLANGGRGRKGFRDSHGNVARGQGGGRFDPSVVREGTETYAVSREFAPFRNGGAASLESSP